MQLSESMELSDYIGKVCKGRIAYEFIPKKSQEIDIEQACKKLRERDILVEIETPFLALLRIAGHQLSLFKSGKIMIKDTSDPEESKIAALALLEKLK